MQLNVQKIEEERNRLGMKKIYFAGHLGLNISAYGKMLRKKSTALSTINKIAGILNLDPKDLLTN